MTVAEWLGHHIDHLTGLAKSTLADYRAYASNDITPVLGPIPLVALSATTSRAGRRPCRQGARARPSPTSTAFSPGRSTPPSRPGASDQPAAGQRLPRTERADMVCLSREEFAGLLDAVTEPWRPLVEFLVASGSRWGEATALRPCDVDRAKGTVRITRAWKRTYSKGGYELGPPKTRRSIRTINVPTTVLDKLDYTGEWLFTNRAGRPVRHNGFHERVWRPAVARAGLKPRPRVHDLGTPARAGWWRLGCRCRSCRPTLDTRASPQP